MIYSSYGTNNHPGAKEFEHLVDQRLDDELPFLVKKKFVLLTNSLASGQLFLPQDPWIIYDPSGPRGLRSSKTVLKF